LPNLNRGAPASHRSEFQYAEDTISRDQFATEVEEFYFGGLLESFFEVFEHWHAGRLGFELN